MGKGGLQCAQLLIFYLFYELFLGLNSAALTSMALPEDGATWRSQNNAMYPVLPPLLIMGEVLVSSVGPFGTPGATQCE